MNSIEMGTSGGCYESQCSTRASAVYSLMDKHGIQSCNTKETNNYRSGYDNVIYCT